MDGEERLSKCRCAGVEFDEAYPRRNDYRGSGTADTEQRGRRSKTGESALWRESYATHAPRQRSSALVTPWTTNRGRRIRRTGAEAAHAQAQQVQRAKHRGTRARNRRETDCRPCWGVLRTSLGAVQRRRRRRCAGCLLNQKNDVRGRGVSVMRTSSQAATKRRKRTLLGEPARERERSRECGEGMYMRKRARGREA
jgi:hypothetical protein